MKYLPLLVFTIILLYSFIPSTSEKIAKQFGLEIEFKNIKKPLMRKLG